MRLADRLKAKVDIDASSGCWNWTGRKDKEGYGTVWVRGTRGFAHRASYGCFKRADGSSYCAAHRLQGIQAGSAIVARANRARRKADEAERDVVEEMSAA